MQITLRGIDPALAAEIRRISSEEGISLNKAALRLLARGAGIPSRGSRKRLIGAELDHLLGTWSDSDAAEFLESVHSCDQVDESFWR